MAARRLLFDVQRPYKPRIYREILGEPYTIGEYQSRYRFSPQSLAILAANIQNQLERPTQRSHAIPVETQLKMALRFYASGSFFEVIGDTFGYHKSTVSRCIHSVTDALVEKAPEYIVWPSTPVERQRIVNGFYSIAGFPSVIGAVDGTHVRIQAPVENEFAYVNRKNFHSINVQCICDHEGMLHMSNM